MALTEKIVSAFIAGDTEAFKTVYETTKRSIYTVAYRMTGDHHEAEDIVHDVYVRAYDKRRLYNKAKAGLHTWLYQMAVNYTLNILKKNKRIERNTTIESIKDSGKENDDDQDDRTLARAMLDKVSPDFRTCVILRDIEDRPYEEIAHILGISLGTVRSRINRGRKQLKELFHAQARR